MGLLTDSRGVEQPRAGAAHGGGDWGGLALVAMRLNGGAGGRSDGNVASRDGECARRRPLAGI